VDATGAPHVRLSGVTMVYQSRAGPREVLRGIDLEVPRGQCVAVLGPSGAGKSTLLRLVAGLQRPSSGRICVGDVEVSALDGDGAAAFRRGRAGIVFQFFNLMPMLSVEENVALPLLLAGQQLAAVRPQVAALLERLGVAEHRRGRVQELSGGQLQRVALARALVGEPELVLADEPTGNLDAALGLEILALLRELCEERRVTTLLMTHDLRAVSYAHRVIRLRNGRIERDLPNPYPVERS
jgi:ABC-type lipoprotein export system ATPase subunit